MLALLTAPLCSCVQRGWSSSCQQYCDASQHTVAYVHAGPGGTGLYGGLTERPPRCLRPCFPMQALCTRMEACVRMMQHTESLCAACVASGSSQGKKARQKGLGSALDSLREQDNPQTSARSCSRALPHIHVCKTRYSYHRPRQYHTIHRGMRAHIGKLHQVGATPTHTPPRHAAACCIRRACCSPLKAGTPPRAARRCCGGIQAAG